MEKNLDYIEKYQALIDILVEPNIIDGQSVKLKDDFEKFYLRGNKRAGIRIRKSMQTLRRAAEDIRNDVQEYKKDF